MLRPPDAENEEISNQEFQQAKRTTGRAWITRRPLTGRFPDENDLARGMSSDTVGPQYASRFEAGLVVGGSSGRDGGDDLLIAAVAIGVAQVETGRSEGAKGGAAEHAAARNLVGPDACAGHWQDA